MSGQQFLIAASSSLFARRIVVLVLSQRAAYDEDHAYFSVGEVLGTMKKGSDSNHHCGRCRARSSPCLECFRPSPVFFINIGVLNGEANSDMVTPATVTSTIYHGRSRLYTLVTLAMVIYHTSCPAYP